MVVTVKDITQFKQRGWWTDKRFSANFLKNYYEAEAPHKLELMPCKRAEMKALQILKHKTEKGHFKSE